MPENSVTETTAPTRLLLIEASGELAARLAPAIAADFVVLPDMVKVTTGRAAVEMLRSSRFDAVAADLASLADLGEGSDDRIGKLARAASGALIVILTADASISVAMSAMRAGAHDCVGASCDGVTLVERLGELAVRHGKNRVVTRSAGASARSAADVSPASPSIPVMRDLVLPMWRQEQRIIETAIQSFAGNIALAAQALELSPSTIYRKRQAWAELDQRRGELSAAVSAR
jgi:DNA-binding NtrC family response regulator